LQDNDEDRPRGAKQQEPPCVGDAGVGNEVAFWGVGDGVVAMVRVDC
jgi:hypothetical protein